MPDNASLNRMTVEAADPSETALHFYLSPAETWAAMYADCLSAQKSILFEQYILEKDGAGDRFMRLFAEKARQGVHIHLVLDGVGSMSQIGAPLIDEIRRNGGHVRFFNPVRWYNLFTPARWFPRSHIKTLAVDSSVAYVGGVCIAKYMEFWRDTQARATGPIVSEIETRLLDGHRLFRRRKRTSGGQAPAVRYEIHHPRLGRNLLYRELLQEIRRAERRVWLVSPYFLPPLRLRRALRAAARKGVDVRVMMSRKTDVRLADHVSHSFFPQFFRAGIKIDLYDKTVLHAKYAIIDGGWATVGSTNMDYLSLLTNREANLILRDAAAIGELQAHFSQDLLHCIRADMQYWRDRPLLHKIAGYAGRTIKHIL